MNNNHTSNELRYTNWKVYIDNTSIWFDEINKKISKCYTNTNLIIHIFPEIRSFADSRAAQLKNFDEINSILIKIETIIYSTKYKEFKNTNLEGKWNLKVLHDYSRVIRLLSVGLSNSDLIPKFKKVYDPSKAVAEIE